MQQGLRGKRNFLWRCSNGMCASLRHIMNAALGHTLEGGLRHVQGLHILHQLIVVGTAVGGACNASRGGRGRGVTHSSQAGLDVVDKVVQLLGSCPRLLLGGQGCRRAAVPAAFRPHRLHMNSPSAGSGTRQNCTNGSHQNLTSEPTLQLGIHDCPCSGGQGCHLVSHIYHPSWRSVCGVCAYGWHSGRNSLGKIPMTAQLSPGRHAVPAETSRFMSA